MRQRNRNGTVVELNRMGSFRRGEWNSRIGRVSSRDAVDLLRASFARCRAPFGVLRLGVRLGRERRRVGLEGLNRDCVSIVGLPRGFGGLVGVRL